MLFSELNKINLNVLIQEPEHELVPDISSCYVHNAEDWTIFCQNVPNIVELNDDIQDLNRGWKIHELEGNNIENDYLYYALNDISTSIIDMSTDISSNLVKIYAGKFDANGTLNYNDIIENEGPFDQQIRCNRLPPSPTFPIYGSWWTFNNGAFQWIGGVKSTQECRFSYGPFTDCDPHHFDSNHAMLDDFLALSIIPNIIFIFDELHVLKGIVSLPCATENIAKLTKNFLSNLINYALSNYDKLTFDEFDNVLHSFSESSGLIPTIRVAAKTSIEVFDKPCDAIFELRERIISDEDQFEYVFANEDDYATFLQKSIWKTYSIANSLGIEFKHDYNPTPLVPGDAIETIINHINDLQVNVVALQEKINNAIVYTTKLSEHRLIVDKNNPEKTSTALMSLSDLFRNAKNLENLYKDDVTHIIVLPKDFCNKKSLNYITSVKYID